MSLLPNITYANLDTPLFALPGSGGGGGGPAIGTSSITVSTITAAGTLESFFAGSAKPEAFWQVGLDGINNSGEAISAGVTKTAYRDVRISDGTGTPVELLRTEISQGSATIGYAPNPAAAAQTGFTFISSLNGGPSGTALLSSTDRFPLGTQQVITSNTATLPAGAFGVPISAPFSTISGHVYQVSFGVQEQVASGAGLGGVVNPEDRVSYVVDTAILDTILHSQISTLQVAQPRGRIINACFQANTANAQVTITNNTGSLLSTIYTGPNNPAFLIVNDVGPVITLP